ncbi:BA14K family protein [Roseibium sp. M-1]
MPIWKSFVSRLAAGSLALGLAMPVATAAPLPLYRPLLQPDISSQADVLRIDHRRGHNSRRYYQQGGRHYYNGHRGYRKYRQGYRSYNGWWFPPAAFAFGFAVAPPAPRYVAPPRYGRGLSPAHYQWCGGRYRSYRPYDNTFQPYHGPRRACFSPYGP